MIFSVIVYSHNNKETIVDCINSLLHQKFPYLKFEIILVDDASTDGTLTKISKISDISVLKLKEYLGPSEAFNFGVSKSVGKYLFFTHANCFVPNDLLREYYELFKTKAHISAIGGLVQAKSFGSYSKFINYHYSKLAKKKKLYVGDSLYQMPISSENFCVLKNVFENVGNFSKTLPNFSSLGFLDLKSKLLKNKKKILFSPIPVQNTERIDLEYFINFSKEVAIHQLFLDVIVGKNVNLIKELIIMIALFFSFPILFLKFKCSLQLAYSAQIFLFQKTLYRIKHRNALNEFYL